MIKSLLAFLFIIVVPAYAQSEHSGSVTISPFHLQFPILETTVEIRVKDNIGVAGIFGTGNVWGIGILELGSQGCYYILGDFQHGLQLGAEALYKHFSLSNQSTTSKPDGKVFSIGPYLGYKYSAGFGLTAQAQAGAAAGWGKVIIRGGYEGRQTATFTGPGIFINLNLGWSF